MVNVMNNIREQINLDFLPRHVGIIMDGNGRWATRRGLPRTLGHREGMKRVVEIVKASSDLGISHLTLYAFSTENWKRPKAEIEGLMNLLIVYIEHQLNELHRNHVKLNILGDTRRFPNSVQAALDGAVKKTSENHGMVLNIALNYGGRQDIIHAIKSIISMNIDPDLIDESLVSNYLYTKGQPDLDLVLRPSGEQRLSNFLLFQSAYAELYFTNILWPDFKADHLYEAILDYQQRDRRFGGI